MRMFIQTSSKCCYESVCKSMTNTVYCGAVKLYIFTFKIEIRKSAICIWVKSLVEKSFFLE